MTSLTPDSKSASQPKKLMKVSTRRHGDLTRQKILAFCKQVLATEGVEGLAYQSIANGIDMTRQLVKHHFPDKSILLAEIALNSRAEFQQQAIAKFGHLESADEMLESYIKATFGWVKDSPENAIIWAQYIDLCARNASYQKTLQDLVEVGLERICELIRLGMHQGKFAAGNVKTRAKLIQSIIQGSMMVLLVEIKDRPEAIDEFEKSTLALCLNIAKTPG